MGINYCPVMIRRCLERANYFLIVQTQTRQVRVMAPTSHCNSQTPKARLAQSNLPIFVYNLFQNKCPTLSGNWPAEPLLA